MKFTYVDTKQINDIGNDIINLANRCNVEFTNFFNKISNIPYDSGEWTGSKAREYSSIVSLDKQDYLDFCEELKKFGSRLNLMISKVEDCAKKTSKGIDYLG